eukprot:65350_1
MRIPAILCIISICLFGFITTAINITSFTWTTLPITMPFSRHDLITSFDINTGLVWILGGYPTSDDIYQWNMTSNNFTYVGALSRYAFSSAQNWVAKDDIIYWIEFPHEKTGSIRSFNMTSAMEIANDLDASYPSRAGRQDSSCVTTDHDKYLIIVGGFDDPYYQQTQIYSFGRKEWLSNMPQLNERRSSHSCHVYKASYVYAIAGNSDSGRSKTVEKLDLETMSNWIMTPHQLSQGRYFHRSVLIDHFIIVTGGYTLKSVDIISMIDDSITHAVDLNIGVERHGIIRGPMNNVIVIGGLISSYVWSNKIQVSSTFLTNNDPNTTTTDEPNADTTDDSNKKTTGEPNTDTTDEPNTPTLSIQSTNAVTYVVIGAICFFLFCIVCFWMLRKTRNKNERADDHDHIYDSQNKKNYMNMTKEFELIDLNNNADAEQSEPNVTEHRR